MRDGTVSMPSSAGRDGKIVFLRDGTFFPRLNGTVNIYIYIFLFSRCKADAVVREDFPALLVAPMEPSRRRRRFF